MRAALALLAAVLVAACGHQDEPVRPALEPSGPEEEAPFREATASAGLAFTHVGGVSPEYYFCEIVGAGGALFDYDNDGDLDLYLVQGHSLRDARGQPALVGTSPGDRLLRNDLDAGGIRFTDVTEQAGIDARGYGMGVATGDFDGDGWVDLYVTNFGRNALLRNRGDGTFEDVTEASGVGDESWSTSAAFVDYDADGHLDLFVCNYTNFTFANNKPCYSRSGERDYCGPNSYRPERDRLYRNRGDGTFEDVTARSGIGHKPGAGLGVVCADFDGDRRIDIYVANDGAANHLWLNAGDGTFRESALLSGCAVNDVGQTEASMGIDAADFDGDGDDDIFLTHLDGETNTLYVNDGKGLFADQTARAGLAGPSRAYTGFGTHWLDLENDGLLDLVIANGAVRVAGTNSPPGTRYPPGQGNLLFRNLGNGRFKEQPGGAAFATQELSRGAAFGDLDNDGDTDFVLFNNNGPARLFLNDAARESHWIGLRILDGKRDALGARVAVFPASGPPLWRRVATDGSYCSGNDPRVLVGLGAQDAIRKVRVHWPAGNIEEWSALAVDRYTTLRAGEGTGVEE